MPMKPHAGESQDDFMERCMSDMTESHDQDQAVAICMNIWREGGKVYREATTPVVKNSWYVLSDASVDRMDDVLDVNGWVLDNFTRNPIALFNHNKDFILGNWENLKVENGQLVGQLRWAKRGTSPRIDEMRSLSEQNILKTTSVGFLPIERKPREGSKKGGVQFTKQELLEVSLVSVPANPNALQMAKSLGVSRDTLDLAFGVSARGGSVAASGVSAVTSSRSKGTSNMTTPTLAQRIESAQSGLIALKDQLVEHLSNANDTDPDEATIATTTELNGKIARAESNLKALQDAEARLAATSVTTVVHSTNGGGNGITRPVYAAPAAREPRPGEFFMRSLVATVVARARGWRPNLDSPEPFFRALTERFGEDGQVDQKTKAIAEVMLRGEDDRFCVMDVFNRAIGRDVVTRAATAPATTTTSGWASQLVSTGYQDFLQLLIPQSVFPGLAARAMRMTFGRNGVISIPTRVSTPTIAGSFVAEGSPIPVRQGAFSSQTFTPKKMGVISSFTREIAEHSTPAIEGLIRNAMQEDTSVSLDSILLDTTAASTTRPAGIRNGVSGLTATAGGGFAALIGDIKQLTNTLLTGSGGNLRNPVWIMNPAQSLSVALTQNAGGDFPFAAEINQNRFTGYPVIVSGNVTAGMVILLDAADFAVIEGGAPRFDVSDQAVIVYDDTSPAALGTTGSPNVVGAPARSLWQTDSMAIRMILDVNWGFVRSGTITFTTSVTW